MHKYTSGRSSKEYENWEKDGSTSRSLEPRGYGSYALEDKKLQRVVGIAGLDYPLDWPEPEIQWGLAKQFWGKGYASDAIRVIRIMADHHIPEISLISLIQPDNSNSSNLVRAVGAVFEKECLSRNDTWHSYPHLKS